MDRSSPALPGSVGPRVVSTLLGDHRYVDNHTLCMQQPFSEPACVLLLPTSRVTMDSLPVSVEFLDFLSNVDAGRKGQHFVDMTVSITIVFRGVLWIDCRCQARIFVNNGLCDEFDLMGADAKDVTMGLPICIFVIIVRGDAGMAFVVRRASRRARAVHCSIQRINSPSYPQGERAFHKHN